MAVTAGWLAWSVAVLVGTQMVMLIMAKQATEMSPTPLLLALVQFALSAILSAAVSARGGRGGAPWMPQSLVGVITSLSTVWTAGFVLFNAAATIMSPGIVQMVRCVEPLASVLFGFATGKTYTLKVLATLVPICGGVLLASFKGGMEGLPPFAGVGLAMLSNACFCLRPVFQHQLKRHPDHNALDDIGVFFNVTVVGVVLLPPCVWLFEGSLLGPEFEKLVATGQMWSFAGLVLGSSIFFFLYQFTQFKVGAPAASFPLCG
jgi:drug/metabolite transporter (DMT)-like permease